MILCYFSDSSNDEKFWEVGKVHMIQLQLYPWTGNTSGENGHLASQA